MRPRLDGLKIVALAFIIVMVFSLVADRAGNAAPSDALSEPALLTPAPQILSETELTAFTAPYPSYTLTQGLHGFSYGHAAIDLAAGKGTPIRSPISGVVTALFTDPYGNPTLVLENEVYQVTLLHGEYTVVVGQPVPIGEVVGYESNLGYTTDMQGNSCAGRNCGYHTHLNVYDKRIAANVNPLELIQP
jgi:murein DD-endopeptidase MepM/ murein hydrolase activator NlpD